jgi:hypothetical protein
MLAVVVILNVLLAVYLLRLTLHVWRLRQKFSRAANALIVAEQRTHAVLHKAPQAILQGQVGSRELRERYQQLEQYYQRASQALAVLAMGRSLFFNPALSRRLEKSATKRKKR